jgi:hypothetical protein
MVALYSNKDPRRKARSASLIFGSCPGVCYSLRTGFETHLNGASNIALALEAGYTTGESGF